MSRAFCFLRPTKVANLAIIATLATPRPIKELKKSLRDFFISRQISNFTQIKYHENNEFS